MDAERPTRISARGERCLGQWLWDELEAAQGRSFVSDDMCYRNDGEMLAFVQRNLPHVRRVARLFEKINREYERTSSRTGGTR